MRRVVVLDILITRSPDQKLNSREPRVSLSKVREFMDRHYAKALTIDAAASRANLSPYHFIRIFRAAVGQTPHQYLRAKRVERAKELLVTHSVAGPRKSAVRLDSNFRHQGPS